MIGAFSLGSAAIPASMPGEAVEVVVTLQAPMPSDDYDVFILRSVAIPLEDLEITRQTARDVTVTITRPRGSTGSPGIHIFAVAKAGIAATEGKGQGRGSAQGHGQAVRKATK
jgi:hypothetical protein